MSDNDGPCEAFSVVCMYVFFAMVTLPGTVQSFALVDAELCLPWIFSIFNSFSYF